MQKIGKYIIIVVIAVLLFGSGFISGYSYSNRRIEVMESETEEYKTSLSEYSDTIENLRSEREQLNNRIGNLESEIIGMGDKLREIIDFSSGLEDRLRIIYGEISDSRQRIQKASDTIGEVDNGIQYYIERAENP